MAIDVLQISKLIKKQIVNYEKKIKEEDFGTIVAVGDGIATISGLEKVMIGELVRFENDVLGLTLNLDSDFVGVVILGSEKAIKEGQKAFRTKEIIKVKVGDELLGRIINPLGEAIDDLGVIKTKKTREVERIAPGVMTRKSVDQPLETGIKVIDSLIPIGKGQRELIIGDRQTGKTAVAIDTIINQKGKNVKCVYVAIGQKASTIAQIQSKLKEHDALSYTTVVASFASESAPTQYLAPYSGMTIAEEWMETNGDDVLIIFDDLSKHAVAYRTMSLLLRRPPGREAYPGDVFYLHSRLLERACRLNEDYGGGSITALPIIETQAGDISAYIPTNVISITDGQIFMMSELFNSGQKPAVDPGLSVSRVGSSAQIKAIKQVSGSLKLELAQYNELAAFAQFGSDLDENTKKILDHGKKVVKVLQQPQYTPINQIDQTLILFAVKHHFIDHIDENDLFDFEKAVFHHFNNEAKEVKKALEASKEISEAMEKELKTIFEKLVKKFRETRIKVKGKVA